MKHLMLLRHGKSDWSHPGLEDFDRPLAQRGIKASKLIGKYLLREKLVPQRALCSAAVRARCTWELVVKTMDRDVDTEYRRDLYLAEPAGMLSAIAAEPAGCSSLILIGHNPGMDRLTRMVIGRGAPSSAAPLGDNFPTAGLAVIEFDTDDWSAVASKQGRLLRFVRPREL